MVKLRLSKFAGAQEAKNLRNASDEAVWLWYEAKQGQIMLVVKPKKEILRIQSKAE